MADIKIISEAGLSNLGTSPDSTGGAVYKDSQCRLKNIPKTWKER
jgi:hypothetical protein